MIIIDTARKRVTRDGVSMPWSDVSDVALKPRSIYRSISPTQWSRYAVSGDGTETPYPLSESEIAALATAHSTIESAWGLGVGAPITAANSLLEYYQSLPRGIRRVFLDVLPGVQWAIENRDFILARDRVAAVDVSSLPVGQRQASTQVKQNMLDFFAARGIVADDQSPDWVP